MTAEDAAQILLGVFLVAWLVLEALTIWARRPWVVYDPYENRWRAQRAMEKHHRREAPPPPPMDLAS